MGQKSSLLAGVAAGCLVLAQPVFAQDEAPQRLDPLGGEPSAAAASGDLPTCGGGSVSWISGEAEASDVSTAESALSVETAVEGSQTAKLAFRSTGESQAVRIEAMSPNGDPIIFLLDSNGNLITENDDTPDSLNSRIETSLAPGVYCVELSQYGGGNMPATIQVGTADHARLLPESIAGSTGESPAFEACTSETDAAPLNEGALNDALNNGSVQQSQANSSAGYYRFTLTEPTSLTLRANSVELDPILKLFDPAGNVLAENDDAEGLNSRLDFPADLEAGDYCIGVSTYSGGGGTIDIIAEKLDRDTFLKNAYARGELVPPANSSYPVEKINLAEIRQTVLLHSGKAQWIGFELDQPKVITVDAYGSLVGVDTKLALFSTAGAVVAENDDQGNGTTDAKLGPVLLQPGSYALAVTDINNNGGTGIAGAVKPVGVMFDIFTREELAQ